MTGLQLPEEMRVRAVQTWTQVELHKLAIVVLPLRREILRQSNAEPVPFASVTFRCYKWTNRVLTHQSGDVGGRYIQVGYRDYTEVFKLTSDLFASTHKSDT